MFKELLDLIKELTTGICSINDEFGEINVPTSKVGTCILSGTMGRSATAIDWVSYLSKLEPSRRFCHPVALLKAVKEGNNLLVDGPVFTIWKDESQKVWLLGIVPQLGKTNIYLFAENQFSGLSKKFRAGSTFS